MKSIIDKVMQETNKNWFKIKDIKTTHRKKKFCLNHHEQLKQKPISEAIRCLGLLYPNGDFSFKVVPVRNNSVKHYVNAVVDLQSVTMNLIPAKKSFA